MFFSVVVPIFNSEKYLKECVESILSQSFKDFELILVNDGSTDNSQAICEDYQKLDSRVVLLNKPNGGQSSARNLGTLNARGKYVVYLDSDDILSDDSYFQKVYDTAKSSGDVIVVKYQKYFEDGSVQKNQTVLSDIKDIEDKGEMLYALVKKDAFFCSCWSKVTKLSIIKENDITFDENLVCEDMDWYYTVLTNAKSIKVIDENFIYYRQHQGSVTNTFHKSSYSGYIYTLKKWQKIFMDMQDGIEKQALLSSLAKLYCNLLILYAGNTKNAKEFKKQIFSFKGLLKYNLNPRTNKLHKFSKLFGLNLTVFMLKILLRLK